MDDKSFLPKDDSWQKRRANGMLLSDYQVNVLKNNGIDFMKYNNIKEILFDINDILAEEDNDELEQIARELDEKDYYSELKN